MIEGQKCYLRAIEPTDIEYVYKWENDTTSWDDSDIRHPISQIAIETLIAQASIDVYQTRQTRLMICTINDNNVVGCVDMFDFNPYNMRCGIGIIIDTEYRGKGYATEAIGLMCNYLFKTIGIHSIYATMREKNMISQHIFTKCGFEQIGVRKDWIKIGDIFENEIFMQKIVHK